MTTFIVDPNKRGLYIKFLVRMHEAWKSTPGASRKDYLTFNKFTETICRNFSMCKSEAFEYVNLFEELGFVSYVRFHGIKLNYKIKENKND